VLFLFLLLFFYFPFFLSLKKLLLPQIIRSYAKPKKIAFPGAIHSEFTEKLEFVPNYPSIPTYRVMDTDGKPFDSSHDPNVLKILFITVSKKKDTKKISKYLLFFY